ncbi:hypothetical protein K492DRAFT_113310, partial [Lichtheimia hyalospora FSU 10163]
LPTLTHWTLQVSARKICDIPSLSLSQLRRYWHPHWQYILKRPPDPDATTPHTFTYPSFFWRSFWKLSLPHKAFTPWWRLLQHCVGTRAKLHKFQVNHVDSAICPICKFEDEDLYHMFVGCSDKRPFWRAALNFFQIDHLFPTQDLVWQALTSMKSYQHDILSDSILCRLGCIIAVLWRHHWRCTLENEPWTTHTILSTL